VRDRVPYQEWTDDEWLWSLLEHPDPTTDIEVAERAVAERRQQNEGA
jgi:hypothetical protein